MECILMKWLITEYKERLAYIRLLIVHFFRYRPIVALFLSLVQDTCHVLVSRYTWENHARVGVKKKNSDSRQTPISIIGYLSDMRHLTTLLPLYRLFEAFTTRP